MGVNKKNAEGYQDPTAYEALTNIVKEERSARAFRPIVYICSPFSGNTEVHIGMARAYCRFAVDKGYLPIAPHLLFPQFLDDADQFERKLGCRFGEILMDRRAEVWVFGSYFSKGMKAEIQRAKRKGYTIRYFNEVLKEYEGGGQGWQ